MRKLSSFRPAKFPQPHRPMVAPTEKLDPAQKFAHDIEGSWLRLAAACDDLAKVCAVADRRLSSIEKMLVRKAIGMDGPTFRCFADKGRMPRTLGRLLGPAVVGAKSPKSPISSFARK